MNIDTFIDNLENKILLLKNNNATINSDKWLFNRGNGSVYCFNFAGVSDADFWLDADIVFHDPYLSEVLLSHCWSSDQIPAVVVSISRTSPDAFYFYADGVVRYIYEYGRTYDITYSPDEPRINFILENGKCIDGIDRFWTDVFKTIIDHIAKAHRYINRER